MNRLIVLAAAVFLVSAASAPAQDWAKDRLEKSTRHREYVKLKSGDREVNTLVVYPEVKDKAPTVVIAHEIFGLADWIKLLADEFAEAGYIAVAPDLLSGKGPKGGGTEELGGQDAIIRAVRDLPPDQVTADLKAAVAYGAKLPAANGKVVVAGYCWGGGQAFRLATNDKDIKAAFVFYGPPPANEGDLARIGIPIYGFYGGNDARINATIPKTTEQMKKAGKTYEPVTYEGAGHGFLRQGDAPNAGPADKKAHDEAWARMKEIMKKL